MTYYEVGFKLQHQCPYSDFSKNNPSAIISHWCNWSRDVLEISQDPSVPGSKTAVREMLRALGSRVIRSSGANSKLQMVLQHCVCDQLPPPTLPTIEKRNCLNIQPMIYTGGWEWYRILAFSERDVRNLFNDLGRHGNVVVTSRSSISEESVHDNTLVSTRSLLGSLTAKQAKALVAALDCGYYDFPRGASAEEVAQRVGVPRTTFVDHLRKAQNKVVRAVGPYARLKSGEGR